jgi:hypothetical protein
MSEDTKVEEKKTEEIQDKKPEVITESQQEVKQKLTIEEMVKANQDKFFEDEKSKETKVEEAKKLEEELRTGEEPTKVKKPAHEVIRELKKERNEARIKNSELESTLSKLNDLVNSSTERLAIVEDRLKSGEITKKEAVVETKNVLEEIEDIEWPVDLEPYKDTFLKAIDKITDRKIAPILEEKERSQKETQRNEQKVHWNEMVGKYPELFDEKVDGNGWRELKPNIEKQAMEMVDVVDMSKSKGVELILSRLYEKIGAVAIEKEKIEKQKEAVKQTKETKVETSTVHPITTKPKSVEDYVRKNMKNAGMEVR